MGETPEIQRMKWNKRWKPPTYELMFSKTVAYQSDVICRAEERAPFRSTTTSVWYSADLGSEHPKKGLRGTEVAHNWESNQGQYSA